MPALRKRLPPRYLTDSRLPEPVFCSVTDFYREEFIKCQRCLDKQREYYSEHAIRDMEKALVKVMSELDKLCAEADADQVVSRLLRQFDVVTCLFGAIAYAKTFASLRKAVRCLVRHLRLGGVLVVEPWIRAERFVVGRRVFDRADGADLKVARMYITRRKEPCPSSIHTTSLPPPPALRILRNDRSWASTPTSSTRRPLKMPG